MSAATINPLIIGFVAPELKEKICDTLGLSDKEICLLQVKSNPDVALRNATESYQDDFEIVMAAISQQGDTLEYASSRLQDDFELLAAAIDTDNYAHIPLKYASARLQDNKLAVTLAVEKNGHALEFASERLKNDKDLLSRAMVTSVHAYQYA